MTKRELIWICAALLAVFLGILGINYAIKRKKARAIFAEVEDKINQNIGADGTDTGSLLYGTKVDSTYQNAESDAKAIYESNSLFWDDNEKVFGFLSKKTKGQIAAIDQSMQQLYGKSLDQAMKEIFDNCYWGVGPDCGEYDRAMKIIKSAK
jgi:hypothetical protein